MSTRVLIIGTGLIGASLGLALKALGSDFDGTVLGWDADAAELGTAQRIGAIDEILPGREAVFAPGLADIYVLATPVLPILDWMERLAPVLGEGQLVTDVGSTKQVVVDRARALYNGSGPSRLSAGSPDGGQGIGRCGACRGDTVSRSHVAVHAGSFRAGKPARAAVSRLD